MLEEKEIEPAPFDAEWEIAKMRGRFTDILNMLEELKATDRTLSARISRLKLKSIQAEDEEPEEGIDDAEMSDVRGQIESLSIDERAVLFAKLLDRE